MNRLARCLVVLIAVFAAQLPSLATADTGSAAILKVRPLGGRQHEVVVYSAAMKKAIPVWVSHPGGPAPALYLLNAVDGGETGGPWTNRTDAAQFFANKRVNVIQPVGGRASYYTDWVADDPAVGRARWSTFLLKELPPLLERHFGMTGRNAVAGTSMSATSALNLAIEAPGRYQAVGSYSGCPRTSDPLARAYVHSQLGMYGANAGNMWGDNWAAHDPTLNASRLRGVALYISSGNGTAGKHDTLTDPSIGGDAGRLADRLAVGGGMESIVQSCTRALTDQLAARRIPATVIHRNGTHAWPYWQDDLHDSWPIFAAALGV